VVASQPVTNLLTSKFQLAGVLIEYGSLDESLYFDRYGDVQIEWVKEHQ
jgi:hypothetical protein